MEYYNIKHPEEKVNFKEALLNGQGKDKGLYFPAQTPFLNPYFIENIEHYSNHEIALNVLSSFMYPVFKDSEILDIIKKAFNFDTPVYRIHEHQHLLSLYEGPTQAFKDIGARFMACCLEKLTTEKKVVLVATSGDTGGAVANAFYNVKNVDVVVLFPADGVSLYQKEQMCSLGNNIYPIDIQGDFDDCQALVKQAFADDSLSDHLTSANSINIGRLLPQMVYYFWSYKELKQLNKELVYAVPSGNFGNLTAGLLAKKMGLPIKRFVAACNANEVFPRFLKTNEYLPQSTVKTIANAMDVGNPSNFPRIMEMYDQDINALRKDLSSFSYQDEEVLNYMSAFFLKHDMVLDPHSAIASLSLEEDLQDGEHGVFLGTASPIKFADVISQAGLRVDMPYHKFGQMSYQNIAPDYEKLLDQLSPLFKKSAINE